MKKNKAPERVFWSVPLWTWAMILLPAGFIYSITAGYDFSTLDDRWLVTGNEPFLNSDYVFFRSFAHPVLSVYYRPVFMISLLCDYWLWELDAGWYHITNVILHLVATALVMKFLLVNKVSLRAAAAFSLLFSLHPLHLHAVAWVPGRNDVLLTIFVLLSLIFLIQALHNKGAAAICLHMVFFIMALFVKETALALPVICGVILLTERVRQKRLILRFAVCWLSAIVFYLSVRKAVLDLELPASQSLVSHMNDFSEAILLYLGKMIVVTNQSLMPVLSHSYVWPGLIMLLLGIFIGVALRFISLRRAMLGLTILFGFLALPVWFATASPGGEQYEHRAYLPVVGLALFLSQLRIPASLAMPSVAAAIIVAVIYAVQVRKRIGIYHDEEIFVETGLKENPAYYLFYHQKAVQLIAKEDFSGAVPLLEKSLALRPGWPQSYSLRAHCYYSLGRAKECIADYNMLDQLVPGNPLLYGNRMAAYWLAGDLQAALADMHRISKEGSQVQLSKPILEVAKKLTDSLNILKSLADQPGSPATLNLTVAEMYRAIENVSSAAFYEARASQAGMPKNTVAAIRPESSGTGK